VERAGGHIVDIARSLCSENKKPPEEWYMFTKIIENIINSSRMECLGGKSPLEVCSGTAPRKPLDVLVDGHGDEAKIMKVTWAPEDLAGRMDALLKELADIQEEAWEWSDDVQKAKRGQKNVGKKGRDAPLIQLGDYVMTRRRAAAESKLTPTWDGPHQVIRYEGNNAYVVKDILNGKEHTVHAQHVARYCDSAVHMTQAIKRQAAHDRYGFTVRAVERHRLVDWRYQVQLVWKGFDDDDDYNLYEDLEYAMSLVPQLVKRYLRKLLKATKKSGQEDARAMLKVLHLKESSVLEPALGDL
jgi:hypothetical protein